MLFVVRCALFGDCGFVVFVRFVVYCLAFCVFGVCRVFVVRDSLVVMRYSFVCGSWLLIVGSWLLAVGCWLLVVGCCVVRCLLFAGWCFVAR